MMTIHQGVVFQLMLVLVGQLLLGVIRHHEVEAFSPAVERKHLVGIWKLKIDPDGHNDDKQIGSSPSLTIKLQDDGTFQQFDDNDSSDDGYIEGCWDYDEDQQLQLAIDRRCRLLSRGGGDADTLLSGKVCRVATKDTDDNNSTETTTVAAKGEINEGRFMYPTSHAAFFDQVLATSNVVGKFSLKQVMAFHSFLPSTTGTSSNLETQQQQQAKDEKTTHDFQTRDFFGRKFMMTVVPIECRIKPQKVWDKELRQYRSPLDDQAVDIRTMKIEFYANSTFQAWGINKILRGRFEVTKDGKKLWFHVSRFGMGRSTPGSVYSEGIGLSHEDERTYEGSIETGSSSSSSLRVQGKVTFGADLGSDARPEPVGEFLLTEVGSSDALSTAIERQEGSSSDAEDDIFDSVFE